MKNRELQTFNSGLEFVKAECNKRNEKGQLVVPPGIKFSHALVRNSKGIKRAIETILETYVVEGKAKDYEEARIKLCKKESNQDKNGNAIIKNGAYSLKDPIDFTKKLTKLKVSKEHKEGYEALVKIDVEYQKYLDEEIPEDVSIYKIKLENCPDGLSPDLVEMIYPMIEEED